MKDSRVYLIHIRDCLTRIKKYTVEEKEAFLNDIKTQDAVLRNIQVMCEYIQKLPIDWKMLTLRQNGVILLASGID